MADQHTMWSQTLLDDFIKGMKNNRDDGWVLEQLKELRGRGMSPDYLGKLLRRDAGDKAADRLAALVKRGGMAPVAQKKGGLLGKLFSK